MIEQKAAEIVRDIIENSTALQESLGKRLSDKAMSLKFLETKLKATKSRLEECEQEEKNLNRRLDFLLESSSDDAAREFRSEYLTKKDRFSDERIRLRKELSELERKYAELSESEFPRSESRGTEPKQFS